MADEPEKTPIQNAYVQRFTDDIEANRKKQADVTEQIVGLQKRLDQLRVDEAWLTQAQGTLPAVVAPPEAGPAAEVAEEQQSELPAPAAAVADAPQTVPKPRQDQPVKAAQPKQAAKKATAAKNKTTGQKTTAKAATAKKTTPKTAPAEQASAEETTAKEAPAEKAAAKAKTGPPLHELILAILLRTPGEPHMAREVTDQLAQDHPDRATSVQTVRNNLENLVKKDAVEKSHQQGSAMYVAYAANEDVAPAADTAAGGEGEQAAETVPAKV